MNRRLKQAAVAFVVLFAAAQFVRPEHANPPTDVKRTIQSRMGTTSGVAAVLNRACRDCHTNATVWPAYAQFAPLSWLMKHAVTEGRKTVNFSEWGSYSAEQQRSLLALSCRDMTEGKMPGVYTLVRPETRLSAHDIETVCAAARQAETEAALR
jgi:heme-binding protein